MQLSKPAAAALASAAFLAVGCGSSKSSSPGTSATAASSPARTATQTSTATTATEIKVSTGKPLARAVWIARGDAICNRANSALSSTTAKATQDFARLLPQAAAYEHTEAAELSKLVPPAAVASDWQHAIEQLLKFSELSARVGQYAQAGKYQEATPLAQAGDRAQTEFVAIAKRDGFKVCSIP